MRITKIYAHYQNIVQHFVGHVQDILSPAFCSSLKNIGPAVVAPPPDGQTRSTSPLLVFLVISEILYKLQLASQGNSVPYRHQLTACFLLTGWEKSLATDIHLTIECNLIIVCKMLSHHLYRGDINSYYYGSYTIYMGNFLESKT